MVKREAKKNTILNQYLREKKFYCYYELKVVRGKTFNFAAIEINQDEGLPALSKEGLTWKLSDEDSRKKPCDGFCAPPLPTYLVLHHGVSLYFVRYYHIEQMKLEGATSIHIDVCKQIADKVVHIV